jgi:hypothetical protein
LRIAIETRYEPEHHPLPHQALWFVVMLISLMLLLTKSVATTLRLP